MLQLEG